VEALWKRQTAAERSSCRPQQMLLSYQQEVARSSRAPPILLLTEPASERQRPTTAACRAKRRSRLHERTAEGRPLRQTANVPAEMSPFTKETLA
jgi:hypothetical protein